MKNSQNIQVSHSPGAITQGNSINANIGGAGSQEEEAPRVRILFLAANPAGTSPLRLDHEAKAITEALRSSRSGERFELQQSWAAGERELQDGLLRYKPDIVHLGGHGNQGGQIILERNPASRDLGVSSPMTTEQAESLWLRGLARTFEAARGQVRCVVLNTCHSETAARVLAQLVGCVVGMSNSFEDDAAIRFSWAFYNALAHGMSVKAAFDLATAQILLGNSPMADVPRLVTVGVDPKSVVFG